MKRRAAGQRLFGRTGLVRLGQLSLCPDAARRWQLAQLLPAPVTFALRSKGGEAACEVGGLDGRTSSCLGG